MEINYPKELLQILVVNSGSTDDTYNLAKKFSNDQIEIITEPQRCGKGSGINYALKFAKGTVIVITDADAYLNKESLKTLVGYFANPDVGIVGGRIFTKSDYFSAETSGTSFFRDFENFLSEHESVIDSTVNVGGELLAVRKELATVENCNLAEDMDCILNARLNGYRVLYDKHASAWEHSPTTTSDIIIQKKRVAIGTIQNLVKYRQMLFSPKFGSFGLLFLPGHKLAQLINCFFLPIIFGSSIVLCILSLNAFTEVFVFFELILLFLLTLSWYTKINKGPFAFFRFFGILQLSLWHGWRDYFRGNYTVKWEKINSKRIPPRQEC